MQGEWPTCTYASDRAHGVNHCDHVEETGRKSSHAGGPCGASSANTLHINKGFRGNNSPGGSAPGPKAGETYGEVFLTGMQIVL